MYSRLIAPHDVYDQVDRNLLSELYSTKTRKLNAVQKNEYDTIEHDKLTTTYRDEIVGYGLHGNLINHYGNNVNDEFQLRNSRKYLNNTNSFTSKVKPFLTPSYHNLTQSKYMVEKQWNNYSKNYQTSDDNVNLKKFDPLDVAQKTKLQSFFKIGFKPIANVDHAAVYANEEISGNVNDYFTNKKYVRPEMVNIRDKFAESMELSDYLRNKRGDEYVRQHFGKNPNGQYNLDLLADMFTNLIAEMHNVMRYIHMLDYHAVALRKMFDNLTNITEKVLNSNILDRKHKPVQDRIQHMKTEKSIIENRNVLLENKDFANRTIAEAQILLNTMKLISNDYVNKVLEEAKCIFIEKLDPENYQRTYIRDSNGYIRKDAKRAIDINAWLKMSTDLLAKSKAANKNAEKLMKVLIAEMDDMSTDISYQWVKTHEIVKKQLIDNDVINNDKLLDQQRECKREVLELRDNIEDTQRKLKTAQIVNEVNLTQLQKPLPNIDMLYDKDRFEKIDRTNRIWSCVTSLRNNLNDMQKYKDVLEERNHALAKRIQSSHSGINYDYRTIENPRKYATSVYPSVDLVSKTISTFY